MRQMQSEGHENSQLTIIVPASLAYRISPRNSADSYSRLLDQLSFLLLITLLCEDRGPLPVAGHLPCALSAHV